MARHSSSRTCRSLTFSPMKSSFRSGRAECAAPTCNSWTGTSGNMPTSQRRSRWVTKSPVSCTSSAVLCLSRRDFGRATTSLSWLGGVWAGWRLRGVHTRPARYLIKVDSRLKFEELAPLTDAGLTPYRGIKKLRDAGALGPDRVLGVFGVGGLGGYAVQYAKLLGSCAKVVAFGRNADKLNIARQYGADLVISVKGKSSVDIAKELNQAVGQKDLDAIIDCAGAPEMMQLAFSLLSISGHYADVGLVGDCIDIPLFPRVSREQTFHGSFWGNYTDLSEVMALAAENTIRHSIQLFKFDEINETLDLLRTGDIVGRAVMKF